MLRCRADDLQSLRERSTADATRLRKRPISRRGKRVLIFIVRFSLDFICVSNKHYRIVLRFILQL